MMTSDSKDGYMCGALALVCSAEIFFFNDALFFNIYPW